MVYWELVVLGISSLLAVTSSITFRFPSLSLQFLARNSYLDLHGGKRCYDCSYHYAKDTFGQCRNPDDTSGARKMRCDGQCFIRRDNNGFVYRGCWNENNFPSIKPTEGNCSHQGSPRALWYFCHGNLCNDLDLVEECSEENSTFIEHPCSGVCKDYSGLYADPSSKSHYIQCGLGQVNNSACACCQPWHMTCPEGTVWNDRVKQCLSRRKKSNILGFGYKYGFSHK